MNRENSHKLFVRALDIIPGGVNSPVRACKNVGSEPTFIDYAQGCMIFDEDGNGFIDYIGSWGPMILGHRHPSVVEAITSVLKRGTSFGAPRISKLHLRKWLLMRFRPWRWSVW